MISNRTTLASSAADDPFQTWKEKLSSWSTTNLPSATFPGLKEDEVKKAAEILSKDLDELNKLPGSIIACTISF